MDKISPRHPCKKANKLLKATRTVSEGPASEGPASEGHRSRPGRAAAGQGGMV